MLISAWLRDSLSRAAVVSTVAGALGLTDAMTGRLLVDWIPGDSGSALDTMLELAGGGLTAHQFANPGFTGAETVADPDAVSAQVTGDSAFHSAKWFGHLLPPADGTLRLIVRTQGAITITVGGKPQSFPATAAVTDRELDVTLDASQLAPIELEYDAGALPGQIELLWYVPSAPTPQPIPAEYLFPENGLAVLDGTSGPGFAWRRTHKAGLLIAGLGLTENEIDYAQSAQPFGAFALSELPMAPPGRPDDAVRDLARARDVRRAARDAAELGHDAGRRADLEQSDRRRSRVGARAVQRHRLGPRDRDVAARS